MNAEHLKKVIRRKAMIFRGFLIVLLVAFVILSLEKRILFLRCLVFFSSFIFAAVFIDFIRTQKILSKENRDSDFMRTVSNFNEAQKILGANKYFFEKNNSLINPSLYAETFTFEGFLNLIRSPIRWISFLGIGSVLAFHPIYSEVLEISQISIFIILKILLLSVLQFIFFGMCVSGIYLSISNLFSESKT